MSSIAQMFDTAMQYHRAANLYQAELLYRQILQLDPQHVNALNLLGLIANEAGRSDLAVEYIRQALRILPAFPAAHSNVGMALRNLGKLDEAIAHYQEALRLQPAFPEAYTNLGVALQDQGKLDEAIAMFLQAVRLRPDFAEAYCNLGNAQGSNGQFDEAIASCRKALVLKPGFVQAYNNLGVALRGRGLLDEAIAAYREAVRLNPTYPEAYNNLGIALQDMGMLDEAMASERQALRLRPDYDDAHFNLSLQLLRQGNFAEGWEEYAWRWRSKPFLATNASTLAPEKLWDGSPLQGRTILLHPEQGLGDSIQFARYAPLLKPLGAGRVVLGCPPELRTLMESCEGVDQVVTETPFPPFDVATFFISLPRLLGTTSVEHIPADVPYLDCGPVLFERWRARFAELETQRPVLRVGIAWQGNPKHRSDRWRSVPLEQFSPLAEIAGVRLISLQKGVGRDQLEKRPELALDLGPELTDLAETAAVIRHLDLVITVDTALAHLAGALGAPVWLAVSMVPDWRWLLQREDSPWYPSMRLFRQKTLGQWGEVFERIKIAIEGHANLKR